MKKVHVHFHDKRARNLDALPEVKQKIAKLKALVARLNSSGLMNREVEPADIREALSNLHEIDQVVDDAMANMRLLRL